MIENKKIEISVNNLGRLLISECRYGYTRNNHLMPACAYNNVERLLPEMAMVDEETAIHYAKQLCEECISDELAYKFRDGLDTEYGNMEESISFIKILLNFIEEKGVKWKPYNYSTYTDIINIRDSKKFNFYKITDFDIEISNLEHKGKLIYMNMTDVDINKKLWENFSGEEFTYNRRNLLVGNKIVGRIIRIVSPGEHKGEIYAICLSDVINEYKKEKEAK